MSDSYESYRRRKAIRAAGRAMLGTAALLVSVLGVGLVCSLIHPIIGITGGLIVFVGALVYVLEAS